ncbi:tripartite tricarboxylate transporter TctB family protein [Microvirga tunisiensis]|uniref:Tripartite tricarboxylate transporter TctB family protein n=1 Tax=Microvirga tunisiensis TaxID=2108360 RepID=A0A5N7MIJ8_9HYPH|nr:tripartite tricarboxylate transporter TctB family protein [Microvirga tunisiensis]MPR10338.1 tripartite tricarboxylate transporter TctB family protein [Microvirga tunisiensis]MPR25984.1 tripartite tricarboxylate transporter TctB family protein [Microvirga tunisiensis]
MRHVKDATSVLTGIFLLLVACFAFYAARTLSNFTDIGLGPGFVPNMLAVIQLGLGLALILLGLTKDGEALSPWRLRPLLIFLALAFFAMTIESMGLVIALTGLIFISCAANRGTKLVDAIGLAVLVNLFSVVVFVKAIGVSIPIWPTFI